MEEAGGGVGGVQINLEEDEEGAVEVAMREMWVKSRKGDGRIDFCSLKDIFMERWKRKWVYSRKIV